MILDLRHQNRISLIAGLLILFSHLSCVNKNALSQNREDKMVCKLYKEKTDIASLMKDSPLRDSYTSFMTNHVDGYQVLCFYQIMGKKGYKYALKVNSENGNVVVSYLLRGKSLILDQTDMKKLESLLSNVNGGSYRQACHNPFWPSIASRV